MKSLKMQGRRTFGELQGRIQAKDGVFAMDRDGIRATKRLRERAHQELLTKAK